MFEVKPKGCFRPHHLRQIIKRKNDTVISIIMGSKSNWATMQKQPKSRPFRCENTKRSCSHVPDLMFKHAEARSRGIKVDIAGAQVAQLTC